MGRRKKKRRKGRAEAEDAPAVPKAPEHINRPFAEALAGVRAKQPGAEQEPSAGAPGSSGPRTPERRSPSSGDRRRASDPPPAEPGYSYEDRVAFSQAFADVRPLAPRGKTGGPVRDPHVRSPAGQGAPQPAPRDEQAEARARARLDALVAGDVRFRVTRDGDWIEGEREGAPPDALRALRRRGVAPEAQIDLHGMTGDEAERAVGRFVRERHRWGDRRLLVVHGKGRHSDAGLGVLGDRAVHALTEGRAAPLVDAFATAPARLGGHGALLVQLRAK